ncbi:hypothetical protein KEM54_005900 [Ascosphaera aggregata]|nr:hypothetical protein KEM54_005900 [Ascosphaera aggregata]
MVSVTLSPNLLRSIRRKADQTSRTYAVEVYQSMAARGWKKAVTVGTNPPGSGRRFARSDNDFSSESSSHNGTEAAVFGGEQASTSADSWHHAHELQSPYGRIAGPGAPIPGRTMPHLPPWSSFMTGIDPSEKSIEPGASSDSPTTILRVGERGFLAYDNMGSWANTQTTATATEDSYHIPAVVRPGPPVSWNAEMEDARQDAIMTGHGPATDLRARMWPQQASSDHLPKVYAAYHGGIGHSNLGVPQTSAAAPHPAPRAAASAHHHSVGAFASPLPPEVRYDDGYEQPAAAIESSLSYAVAAPQTGTAGTSHCLKARAPSWCTHYASESPEFSEPVPAVAKYSPIPSAIPPMIPIMPGPAQGTVSTSASIPTSVPVPPHTTSRERRKRGDIMLDGIPAVIHPTPYKCEWPGCNDRFRRNEHLKRHMTSHTGEKPFVCWIPGCGKSFSRSDNLNVHYSTTHSKRGGRNRYVATLDETSMYYDPSYRGDLTPDGLPVTTTLNMQTPTPDKKSGQSPSMP